MLSNFVLTVVSMLKSNPVMFTPAIDGWVSACWSYVMSWRTILALARCRSGSSCRGGFSCRGDLWCRCCLGCRGCLWCCSSFRGLALFSLRCRSEMNLFIPPGIHCEDPRLDRSVSKKAFVERILLLPVSLLRFLSHYGFIVTRFQILYLEYLFGILTIWNTLIHCWFQ